MTRRRGLSREALFAGAYIISYASYAALLAVAPNPWNLYAAALAAGLAGALASGPLWGALASGLGGLSGHLTLLAASPVGGFVAGLARVVGWTPVAVGFLYSLLVPAGVAVVAWHGARGLRAWRRGG
ncbi:MAG: hypothetical protein GSR80_001622 [Desulfurococcales archaeon]|nr:hypothetical protein [Desulfurococcales archaeon]